MALPHLRLRAATITIETIVVSVCILVGSGCSRVKSPPPSTPSESLAEPVIPPGYKKIAPGSVDTSDAILSQTAAIIEGNVSDVTFTYDGCAGPRTNYLITGVKTLVGAEVPPQISVKILGGPLPNGSWVKVSELPKLAVDSHYVVFLRNTDWTFSPIVAGLAFRREVIAGHEVLVNPEGQAVIGWGDAGPVLSAKPVTAAVGSRIHGYRKIPTAATPAIARPSPPLTDPAPEISPARKGTASPGKDRLPIVSSGSLLAQAPSATEIRAAGLFARPAVFSDSGLPERNFSAEALVRDVKTAAEHGHHAISGRVTLDPLWRCWNITPTVRVLGDVTTESGSIPHL